jgi:fatty-acyl-CoA synthase
MLSHRNLMANSWHHLVEGSVIPSDRYLTMAPLCHLAANSRIYLLAHAGATHVIHSGFDPDAVMAAMAGGAVNTALVVPAMVRRLLDTAARDGVDLRGRIRLLTYGGAPMPVGQLTEALERLGCDFQQGYGLTEGGPNLTVLRPQDHRPDSGGLYTERLASVGRETIGVHVRVVDAEDRDVATGEVGEVIARGGNVMEGYWNRPEETAAALRGGWLRTGDVGRMDDEGYLYLVDRSKDMLVSGGFNVYPREVERQLEQHPLVLETAVVGVPDERWGEVPVAYVVCSPGAAGATSVPRELEDFLSERLARYKVPRRYEIVGELPRNGAGKILKGELRAAAAAPAMQPQEVHR